MTTGSAPSPSPGPEHEPARGGYPQQTHVAGAGPPPPVTVLGTLSLIFGLLWLGGAGSILAVVFGHAALSRFRKAPSRTAAPSPRPDSSWDTSASPSA